MYSCFDKQLDKALVLVENIDKKWPHIQKQLLKALDQVHGFGQIFGPRILRGYKDAVRAEMEEPAKQRFHFKIDHTLFPANRTRPSNRYESIVDQAEKSGVPRHERPPTQREYINEYFKRYLVAADPVAAASNGRKTPFVNDIVRWLVAGKAIFPEDIKQINELLTAYVQQKHNMGVKLPDINTVDDPADLRRLVTQYAETQAYNVIGHKKLPPIVDGIDVYRLDTFEEAQEVLCDSGWCVKDPEYFDSYEKPLYLFVRRSSEGTNKRMALFGPIGGEFNDVYNHALPIEKLAEYAPIIDHILTSQEYVHSSEADGSFIPCLISRGQSGVRDLQSMVAPILHLLPKTVKRLRSDDLVNLATYLEYLPNPPRWPDFIEQKLRKNPIQFIEYVDIISGRKRIRELEPDLIGYGHELLDSGDKDGSVEYITELISYFGRRIKEFGVDTGERRSVADSDTWPELTELLYELREDPDMVEYLREWLKSSKYALTGFLYLVGNDWFKR